MRKTVSRWDRFAPGKDTARIFLLLFASFVAVGLMWSLHRKSQEEAKGPAVAVGPAAAPPKLPPEQRPAARLPAPRDTPDIPLDPPQPVYVGDPADVLASIRDARPGQDRQDSMAFELEPKAFAYLLYKVRTTPADAPERKAAPLRTRGELIPGAEEGAAGKNRLRGTWVKSIGCVYDVFEREIVPEPGPSGVHQVYRNFVLDGEGKAIEVYIVYDEPQREQGDPVETEGLYFKLHAYENSNGEQVAVPAIVAERLRRHEGRKDSRADLLAYAFQVALIVAGAILACMLCKGILRGRPPAPSVWRRDAPPGNSDLPPPRGGGEGGDSRHNGR